MPKPKTPSLVPRDAKFTIVNGQDFLRLREATKLAGIHPVVLEMGKQLLERIGGTGAAFTLGTPDMQKNADAIIATFKTGLRRFAKAMEPTKKIKLKAYRDGTRLVFWYTA